MNSLGKLLKSPARIEVLRALCALDIPVGVRALAVLARSHPYATSRVLAELVREDLVEKTAARTRPGFRMRNHHPEAARLRALFASDRETLRQRDAEELSKRAKSFLNFNCRALRVMDQARRSLHGPL